MLVLSRKPGQTIELPQLQVAVRVLKTSPSQVQVGIEAPESIRIVRGELNERDLRLAPLDLEDSPAMLMHQLESQIVALAELSAARDRDLAVEVAEQAEANLRRLRRQLREKPGWTEAEPEAEACPAAGVVQEANSVYQVVA